MELKPISREGIPAALQKGERYRLLNDSAAAESICLDILAVEPDNQSALVMLLLAITDQFDEETGDDVQRARAVLPRLSDDYKRAYYAGIICERKGRSIQRLGHMGSGAVAHDWYRDALRFYQKAEVARPKGNDEAILRWNTCVRLLARHEDPEPTNVEFEPAIGE